MRVGTSLETCLAVSSCAEEGEILVGRLLLVVGQLLLLWEYVVLMVKIKMSNAI